MRESNENSTDSNRDCDKHCGVADTTDKQESLLHNISSKSVKYTLYVTYIFILIYMLAVAYAIISMGVLPVISLHVIVVFVSILVVQLKVDELQNTLEQCIEVIENQADLICNMTESIEYLKYKVGVSSHADEQDDNKPV